MNGYIGGGPGHDHIEVYANNLAEAKQKIIDIVKPRKKDQGLVWVLLAEKDGEQVCHDPAILGS